MKISTGRELFDGLIKNPLKGLPLKENIKDCIDDYKADLYGLITGFKNPKSDCSQLMDRYRPNGLDEKY